MSAQPDSVQKSSGAGSLDQIHAEVLARLQLCRGEIVAAICAHIRDAVPDPTVDRDTQYQLRLLLTVEALVGYSLEVIERLDACWPIPLAVLEQARYVARIGMSLGVVLRRYQAGYHELIEIIADEAEQIGYSAGRARRHLTQLYNPLIERITTAVEDEYLQEHKRMERACAQHRLEIVRRLLVAQPVELAELGYELHSRWHLGLVATGTGAPEVLQQLKSRLGCELFTVPCGELVWAWLGTERKLSVAELERLIDANGRTDFWLAVGEPGRGIDGWRETHQQALLALPSVRGDPRQKLVSYADSPHRLAAALQGGTLARSFERKYLAPLASQRDGGVRLRQTLRAYIDLSCNVSSVSSSLKLGRHTVERHLRTVETLIGSRLAACLTELDLALRLHEIDGAEVSLGAPPPFPEATGTCP